MCRRQCKACLAENKYELLCKKGTYLSGDICNGSLCHKAHAMNASIPQSSGFGFLIYRARRSEDMFEGLDHKSKHDATLYGSTYRNEETTPQQSVPWILSIIGVVCVQEDQPLITRNLNLPTNQLSLNSVEHFSKSGHQLEYTRYQL